MGFCASNLDSKISHVHPSQVGALSCLEELQHTPQKTKVWTLQTDGFLKKDFTMVDFCGSHNISEGAVYLYTRYLYKNHQKILGSKRPSKSHAKKESVVVFINQELIAQAGFELIIVDHESGVSAGGR